MMSKKLLLHIKKNYRQYFDILKKQNKGTSYATIQFRIDEINYVVFTGSSVLSSQLEKYKDNLPFNAVIKKINKYYTFS